MKMEVFSEDESTAQAAAKFIAAEARGAVAAPALGNEEVPWWSHATFSRCCSG